MKGSQIKEWNGTRRLDALRDVKECEPAPKRLYRKNCRESGEGGEKEEERLRKRERRIDTRSVALLSGTMQRLRYGYSGVLILHFAGVMRWSDEVPSHAQRLSQVLYSIARGGGGGREGDGEGLAALIARRGSA
jgi:hypothetical protein